MFEPCGIERGMEIASFADVPRAPAWVRARHLPLVFACALCRAAQLPSRTARVPTACEIELERVKAPIGKQDQYAAAFAA